MTAADALRGTCIRPKHISAVNMRRANSLAKLPRRPLEIEIAFGSLGAGGRWFEFQSPRPSTS